jgi:two-component sensor histidine kinase
VNRTHPFGLTSSPRLAAFAGATIGCAALAGWIFDIPILTTWIPERASLKVSTALCLVAIGASLCMQSRTAQSGASRYAARAISILAATVAAMTLLEYTVGADFGINQALAGVLDRSSATTISHRMAPNTALGLLCLGIVTAFLEARSRATRVVLSGLSAIAFVLGLLAATSYFLNTLTLESVAGFASMALPTSLALCLLSFATAAAWPDRGLARILRQEGSAALALRRQLPMLVVIPVVLGWLALRGLDADFYGPEFGIAALVSACVIVLGGLAFWQARRLQEAELESNQRARDEQFLHLLGEELRTSTDAVSAMSRVSAKLGQYLDVSRCFFSEFDHASGQVITRHDFSPYLPSLAGTVSIAALSASVVAEAGLGRTLVTDDASVDPRLADRFNTAYAPFGMRARIAVPLHRGGRWVASLTVSSEHSRHWQAREVVLVELVAERTWLWVEHIAAVDAIRAMNSTLELRVSERTAALTEALRERDVLLKEVHHRVKNNLQVIISLINMQLRHGAGAPAKSALAECRSRIQAIALIHDKLYLSSNYSNIPFSEYVRGLVDSIGRATGAAKSGVALELQAESVGLPVDKAIPCGLILNELITNALKHAFPDDRTGRIRVGLANSGGREVSLSVADDGVGLPEGFDLHSPGSLGMQLIVTLTEQLGGTIQASTDRGTRFEIRFPKNAG